MLYGDLSCQILLNVRIESVRSDALGVAPNSTYVGITSIATYRIRKNVRIVAETVLI